MNTSTTSVVQYEIVTTPAASYEITFPYYTLSDIQAVLTLADGSTETLTIDEDYTLSAVGNSGTLTRVGTWTAGATRITIARIASFIQDVNFINNAVLNAETLETLFDRIVAYIQQTNSAISRTVTIPITDDVATLELPAKAVRANKALAFDVDGNAVPSEYTSAVITAFMAILLQKENVLDSQKYLELLPSGATVAISAIVQDFLNTGGTSVGTAEKVIRRDANGRAQVAEPSADADIAVKKTVTDHTSATSVHSAASAATASRLMIRDASGRAQVAEPFADADIATKKTVADAIAAKTDQELKTTSSPTFVDATVDTKLLSTYLGYLNQDLKTTASPTFANMNPPVDNNDTTLPAIGIGGFTYGVHPARTGVVSESFTLPAGGTYVYVISESSIDSGASARMGRGAGGSTTLNILGGSGSITSIIAWRIA